MEEYLYEFLVRLQASQGHENRGDRNEGDRNEEDRKEGPVYLPVFWTHLQNHPGFGVQRAKYQMVLNRILASYPVETRFFTCVQHDDGPGLTLPVGTVIYGACTGDVPLPLIYEDTSQRLLSAPRRSFREKDILASFVGTTGTHSVRGALRSALQGKKGVEWRSRDTWSASVAEEDAEQFVEVTSRSRFCLAPRGYGRSSFRFFEAMLLEVVPVYVWDDVEWLPYREEIDYRQFCISIHVSEVGLLYERLLAIGEEEYEAMREKGRRVRAWFTLEGMSQFVERSVGLEGTHRA